MSTINLLKRILDRFEYDNLYDIITPFGFNDPLVLQNNSSDKDLLISKFDKSFNK
ncbi:MAG: hypothetical protein ACFFC3_14725 [Candidatus Odinarchaeota archaeon]